MVRVIKFGEFKVKIENGRAKAYDIRSGRKLFEGSVEVVLKELSEKIEGEIINARRRWYV